MIQLPRAKTVEAALFPECGRQALRTRGVIAAVVFVAAAAGIELLRLPGSLDTLWAEDGRIFLQQARDMGRLHAFTQPYAGYLHWIPRSVAAVVASFPLRWAAALFAIVPAIAVGGLALFVFRSSRAHVASPWWRLVLSGTLVFLPVAGVEMLDNGVNLQWYAMCALFWALLWRPRGVWSRVVQTLLCLVATASDPLTLLFAPFVVARLWAVREWRDQWPVAGWTAGLILQGAVAVSTAVPHSTVHAGIGTIFRLLTLRVATPFFLGSAGTQWVFAHGGWLAVALCATVFVTAVGLVGILRLRAVLPSRSAWMVMFAVAIAALFFVVPVETRWTPLYLPVGRSVQFLGLGSRYVAVPLVALWSAAVVTVTSIPQRRARLTVAAAALVLLGGMWSFDFLASGTTRNLGPRWSAEIAAARSRCAATPAANVTLLTPPPNGVWTVAVPCTAVLSG